VQSLLAEYDADHDRPVSQRECDEVFARAIIPMVLEEAAKVAFDWVADDIEGKRLADLIRAIGAKP